MKRSFPTLLVGMMLGALMFSGLTALADLSVVLSTQKVVVDGVEAPVEAYNINGNNYFKARDFAAAMDIGMWYNEQTRSIMIETDKKYDADYSGAVAAVEEWEKHYKTDSYSKYTTPASENKLDGTMLKVTGSVTETEGGAGQSYFVISNGAEEWLLAAEGLRESDIPVGANIEAFGFYLGVAGKRNNMPLLMLLRYKIEGVSYAIKVSGLTMAEYYESKSFEEIHQGLNGSNRAEAETTTTSPPSSESNSNTTSKTPSTVYITPTGKRYHYLASCAGPNAKAVSINNVGALTPCQACAK